MLGFSDTSAGEESSCIAGDPGTIPGSGILIRCRRDSLPSPVFLGILCGSAGKESVCNAGDLGLIPRFERSPGEGKGCPLQYSCQQNSMDHIVYGVTKSRTRLRDFSLHFQEISPESRLDWSLPVSSGISSLKPVKTHTLAFPGSPLHPLDRKPSEVQTSSQISRRTHRQAASLRSQVELRDHSRNRHCQPLGSAVPSSSGQGSALTRAGRLPTVPGRPHTPPTAVD